MAVSLLSPSAVDFNAFDSTAYEYFREYRNDNFCGDTTFSMFYAWGERFNYRYALLRDAIAVTGIGVDSRRGFCILSKSNEALCEAINAVIGYCRSNNIKPLFEYVDLSETEIYRDLIIENGYSAKITFDEKFSDYLYDTDAFLSMAGTSNKTKRGGYNYITAHYPELKCEKYTPDKYSDCMSIFDKWCDVHKCENCFYGCEKNAFRRFMEIYVPDRHRISVSYDGNKPLSFAVCEKINDNTMCYYFQKNAERIRGLTYWLNRQMAIEHKNVDFINLGEDIGVAGLKNDKTLLRPCKMIDKYTVTVV